MRPDMEVSMEAAAVLLRLAMKDTESPIASLCDALKRLSSSSPTPDAQRDLALCVQSLQFHDRLIQQLEVVRGLLAREKLSQHSQHQLLSLLQRTGVVELEGHAEQGSVELF